MKYGPKETNLRGAIAFKYLSGLIFFPKNDVKDDFPSILWLPSQEKGQISLLMAFAAFKWLLGRSDVERLREGCMINTGSKHKGWNPKIISKNNKTMRQGRKRKNNHFYS